MILDLDKEKLEKYCEGDSIMEKFEKKQKALLEMRTSRKEEQKA